MSDTPRTDKFVRDEVATTCYDDFPGDRAIEEMEKLERESDRLTKYCVHNAEEIGTLRDEVRKLERERDELKDRINTAVTECTQYTPEEWERACHYAEPIAVWLDGKQMTRLMKDAARLEFLIERNEAEFRFRGTRYGITREEIDEAIMEAEQS